MKGSGKLFFVLAMLMAIFGSGALYLYLNDLEKPVSVVIEKKEVVVAVNDIMPQTLITEEMVTVIEIPAEGVSPGSIVMLEDVIGKYTKDTLYANGQIHGNALLNDLNEELSLKITKTFRAITVVVGNSTGVSKLIKVGDFVDVIVYLPQITEQGRIVRPDVTKMLLQNIEILAIDQSMQRDVPQVEGEEEGVEEQVGQFAVTMAVSVMDIEALVLAKDIGTIDLALRPLEGDSLYVTNGAIWQELLLNDMKKIKDLFPEYGVVGLSETSLSEGEYIYEEYLYYTVQFGDTLSKISTKFYGDASKVTLIREVNKVEDENLIVSGTGLKIPILIERGAGDGN